MDPERVRERYPSEIRESGDLSQSIIQNGIYAGTSESKRTAPLRNIIDELHGKISSEDMIIILVMLLISCDGISPETVILALALLAS